MIQSKAVQPTKHGPSQTPYVPKGSVFLDSCVAPAVASGKIVPAGKIGRMAITPTVQRELGKRVPDICGRIFRYSILGERYEHYLEGVRSIHREAVCNPLGRQAQEWIRKKWHCLRDRGMDCMWSDGTLVKKTAEDAVSMLYREAERDRRIIAEAASIAGRGATVVSFDADMWLFHREIAEMTGWMVRVERPYSRLFSPFKTAVQRMHRSVHTVLFQHLGILGPRILPRTKTNTVGRKGHTLAKPDAAGGLD